MTSRWLWELSGALPGGGESARKASSGSQVQIRWLQSRGRQKRPAGHSGQGSLQGEGMRLDSRLATGKHRLSLLLEDERQGGQSATARVLEAGDGQEAGRQSCLPCRKRSAERKLLNRFRWRNHEPVFVN